MGIKSLEYVLAPKRVAVLGVDPDPSSKCPANVVIRNLLAANFNGVVYPICKGVEAISGLRAYPSIKKAPKEIDLAVLGGIPETVPKDLEECGKRGVKGALVLAPDFRHRVKAPTEFVSAIRSIALKYEMRCIGPNSSGFIRPRLSIHVSTVAPGLRPGRLAFLSQSATFASAILDYARSKHIGFSAIVSIGAQADVHLGDYLDFLSMDTDTKAVVMYLDSLVDGRGFMSAARATARIKPVIVVKGRRLEAISKEGHDNDLPIDGDVVYDAAFARAGIVRVEDALELFNVTDCLSKQPVPKGNRLIIITNAGGPATMATDMLLRHGGQLAEIDPPLLSMLNKVLPEFWCHGNPIDCLSDASPERIGAVLKAVLESSVADGILVILTPQYATQPMETARRIVELRGRMKSTQVLACFMGLGEMERARSFLNENGIPTTVAPEQAVKSFLYTFRHGYNLKLHQETPASLLEDFMPDSKKVEEVINKALREKRHALSESESKAILKAYGIDSPPLFFIKSPSDIHAIVDKIPFPVAVKIDAPHLKSRTKKGLVRLHVGRRELERAVSEVMDLGKALGDDAHFLGVTIQPMVYWQGQQLAFGTKKDSTFGSIIFFGIGGKLFYTLNDYSVGLPPLNQTLAKRLVEQTKVYEYMVQSDNPRYNLKLLEQTLLRFSQLVVDFPHIYMAEVNSFYLGEEHGLCLDARITLDNGLDSPIHRAQGPCCPSNLVICPYPCHFIDEETMSDGKPFLVRPIRPEDEPKMYRLFETFSPETIRMRFFQDIREIPHEQMVRYCQIDYDREIALVAAVIEGDEERFIGVGRLTILPNREDSEFAVVVGDPWQKKGIGRILTKRCLEIAKSQGVKRVFMDVLKENVPMKRLAKRLGFKEVETQDEDIQRFLLDLVGTGD